MRGKISPSTKELHNNYVDFCCTDTSSADRRVMISCYNKHTEFFFKKKEKKGLHLHNNNTHKKDVSLQHNSASWWTESIVPPVSPNVFPHLHLSVLTFPRDNLEMPSKSNIFISVAVWCNYWKGLTKIMCHLERGRKKESAIIFRHFRLGALSWWELKN